MTVRLDGDADVATARWLCHGCGAEHPIDGPAYPICEGCGQRCLAVDADGLPFVGSRSARMEAARHAHENAYAGWRSHLDVLRVDLDEVAAGVAVADDGAWARALGRRWTFVVGAARWTNDTAEHLDRVEADVARLVSRGGEEWLSPT